MPTAELVNTGKVSGRRTLRFNTPQEMEADVAKLVAADQAGRLTHVGNWTLGQCLNHLGTWVTFAYIGNPIQAPWFVKLIVKGRKNKYLNQGLPAGVKIPKLEGGTVAIEPMSTADGLTKFTRAWDRMKKEAPTLPNGIFGPLTHQEWINLNLRHAELHLSFLKPE